VESCYLIVILFHTHTHEKWRFWSRSRTKGKESGQNKPPKLNSPSEREGSLTWRFILSILLSLCPAAPKVPLLIRVTKNHPGEVSDLPSSEKLARMYKTPEENNGYKALKFYMAKLNPQCDAFFQ